MTPPEPPVGFRPFGSRRALALLLFGLTLGACGWSLVKNRQLGYMGGLADTWYALGLNLNANGVFGQGLEPTVFKPPGYPAFIAVVLSIVGAPRKSSDIAIFPPQSDLFGLSVPFDPGDLERGALAIYWAQSALLAASAALLFLWLSSFSGLRPAFVAGFVLGINPYCVILTGLLNYSVTHLFLLILGCWSLQQALESTERRALRLALSGVCWGLATLVRPVTLILPPFLYLAMVPFSASHAKAIRNFMALMLGMGLVLAPWTLRNFALTHRLVPVNAQAWKNIWAATVQPVAADPNHFRYKTVRASAIAIESAVAGSAHRVGWEPLSIPENLALEDRFKSAALHNIRERPTLYLGNAWRSFITFNKDLNTVLIKVFLYIQKKRAEEVQQNWFAPRASQDFYPSGTSEGVSRFFAALDVLACLGLIAAVWRRTPALLVPGLIHLCLAVAHSVTWMDLMYYYVKVPFVLAFAFFFTHRVAAWSLPGLGGARRVSLGLVLDLALAFSCLWLAAIVLRV
jgi:hypothetical protein